MQTVARSEKSIIRCSFAPLLAPITLILPCVRVTTITAICSVRRERPLKIAMYRNAYFVGADVNRFSRLERLRIDLHCTMPSTTIIVELTNRLFVMKIQ